MCQHSLTLLSTIWPEALKIEEKAGDTMIGLRANVKIQNKSTQNKNSRYCSFYVYVNNKPNYLAADIGLPLLYHTIRQSSSSKHYEANGVYH
ncbi:hypothetical protein CEXT_610881 [Caerostris extrusa]|uniref:Uncharacterized protein n=1 Tax=Caerostris extrusa TaxID=172846 RepID=A0AAV4NLS3_CAEEX|nr:hypothetical protein CEXT_610881 [Caerostris extrusa]